MISISLTSGMSPRFFLSDLPSSLAVSTSGTSSGGNFHAALPAEDFSKIRPSFWFTWRVALRVMCFIASQVVQSRIDDLRRKYVLPSSTKALRANANSGTGAAFRLALIKCGLMPVPSQLWHFPSPPHKEQVFRDMPTSLLLLTRLEHHRAISSISSFAERTERSLSATTPTAVS